MAREKRFAWPVLCCVVVGSEKGREFLVDSMGQQGNVCWHGQRGSQSRVQKRRSTARRIREPSTKNIHQQREMEKCGGEGHNLDQIQIWAYRNRRGAFAESTVPSLV